MVYFCKSAECVSQTTKVKKVYFVLYFVFEWLVPAYIFAHWSNIACLPAGKIITEWKLKMLSQTVRLLKKQTLALILQTYSDMWHDMTFNMKCDMTWYVIWHVAWHVIWNVTGYSKTWHDMLNDRLHDVTLHDMAQHGMTWDNIHTGSYPNLGGTCRFCHSSEGGTLRYFQ